MKRFVVLVLFMGCIMSSFAQMHRYYCEIKGTQKGFSSGIKIIMDFGDAAAYSFGGVLSSKLQFVDEKGEVIEFNSMVDAANYIVERGWVFQQAYSSSFSNQPIMHWIFYKDAESFEKAREGIVTKGEYKKRKK